MRKTLSIAVAAALALTPTLSLANPLTQLLTPKLGAGACGYPPASNSTFCSCFLGHASSTCAAHHLSPYICRSTNIDKQIHRTSNVAGFCSQYARLLPAGISHQECVTDLTYVKAHC